MGQSPSSPKPPKPITIISPFTPINPDPDPYPNPQPDYTYSLPDETLSTIFHSLSITDRKRVSLVCRRWLTIEGQSRHRLSLNAHSDLLALIPRLFTRFDSVTKLALKCDRRSVSICDKDLILVSGFCPNLTRLKLRACREITDAGVSVFSGKCRSLRKFSCGSCSFGSVGMNSLLENCNSLEELSVKRLRGITDSLPNSIGIGKCGESLKVVCLKDLYNGQVFGPMIVGAKNLRSLKLFRCSGDWDSVLESVSGNGGSGIVEVHLERVQVSDLGLSAVSGFLSLEILHLVKTPECTNFGLGRVAEKCRLLRKLHIDGWKTNRIGDEGLVAVASFCGKLQELVLIGVNPTRVSLEKLASNCGSLERLALCGSETVGDAEVACIAEKCVALKKLCIKSCPVTDLAMEALACGCPNLVKVKVKKCKGVTLEGADWLRASRDSITVNLDAVEPELPDPSIGEPEIGGDGDVVATEGQDRGLNASRSNGRSISFKMRLGSFSGRSLVPCSFRRWSSFGGTSRNNQGS